MSLTHNLSTLHGRAAWAAEWHALRAWRTAARSRGPRGASSEAATRKGDALWALSEKLFAQGQAKAR